MYPLNILSEEIYPIIGQNLTDTPYYIDLSINNPKIHTNMLTHKQRELNKYINLKLKQEGKNWGVSSYLENREPMLNKYPQMKKEKRYYHLGADIILPLNAKLYAPLNSQVVNSFYEEGDGNYGGCIILKHKIKEEVFYTLFGHLNKDNLPQINTRFNKGDVIGFIGDFEVNGNWFHHTHLQVLTPLAYNNGWISKGYCSEKDLSFIDKFCPNPLFLLRIKT